VLDALVDEAVPDVVGAGAADARPAADLGLLGLALVGVGEQVVGGARP